SPAFNAFDLMKEQRNVSSNGQDSEKSNLRKLGLSDMEVVFADSERPAPAEKKDGGEAKKDVVTDKNGRVTRIEEAGGSINFEYDSAGRLKLAVTKDAKGLVKREEIPGGNVTDYEHDDNGALRSTRVSNKDGKVIENSYRLSGGWARDLYDAD